MKTLYTKAGRSLPPIPWERYPRPQLRRKDWLCLNGDWNFSFGGSETLIRVPFCAESLLSRLERAPEPGDRLTYSRSFSVPEEWKGKRILLHFGAVMRESAVFVNGREQCRHDNGYLPFCVDITDSLLPGENSLRVTAVNDLDPRYPWGKQSKSRGGMWYTPCSGIWQTVWLEPVPQNHIQSLRITGGKDWVRIETPGIENGCVKLNKRHYAITEGQVRIRLEDAHLWSPEDPYLYFFTVESGEDCVESYFALRTLTTETVDGIARLCLNGRPYFFNGVLDQGYWSDGLYTPAAPEAYEQDILAMKALGFNTLRKHIKIEPEQFYYDCDRLGMIVFQDMVNSGSYHFLRDTVLPTLHLQRRQDRRLNTDPETRRIFICSMEATARHLGSHPCICLWTIFNEGWGQFCADDAYSVLKAMDSDRWIDSTSGWFHQNKSDVDSLHIYFDRLHLGKKPLPQLLSEFGGYVWKDPEHSFNTEKTYGYRKYSSRRKLVCALRKVYSELLPLVREGLCGAIYTQVSDVEDETNGLMTYDREVLKVRPEELQDCAHALQCAVEESQKQ
ncbi:MAG: glycoside hydrolase family 2 [Oscillospiraceae bacterium]|nr:glycoside hydrolase family 2 [Oscillospiraceae bacterium]